MTVAFCPSGSQYTPGHCAVCIVHREVFHPLVPVPRPSSHDADIDRVRFPMGAAPSTVRVPKGKEAGHGARGTGHGARGCGAWDVGCGVWDVGRGAVGLGTGLRVIWSCWDSYCRLCTANAVKEEEVTGECR